MKPFYWIHARFVTLPQYYLLKILRIGQLVNPCAPGYKTIPIVSCLHPSRHFFPQCSNPFQISVPSEFTTMAGRRLRDAVKGILTSGGRIEFDINAHIVIAELTNLHNIVRSADLRGSIKTEVPLNSTFNRGNTVAVTFWSACPRNDLLTEGTFALAEILPKDIKTWVPAYDDDNFCFKLPAKLSPQSYATIKWRIPDSASFGVYRILAILVPQRVYSGPFAISQGSSSASVLP
ncbi:hypothetical protein DVH24_026622 [Malus domestica]|uniref:Neutral/alkaline non-lysosomal ceramidase C-terminal domain-containing protein n=1 Tax=Malus domestica TaxID=3750 RepID=A0A498K9K6_MALDO|nr:hypothetical protein DVH24_026622 [Malus domestica]